MTLGHIDTIEACANVHRQAQANYACNRPARRIAEPVLLRTAESAFRGMLFKVEVYGCSGASTR